MRSTSQKRYTFAHRLRYAFDNTMDAGPAGLILWLALISIILVLGLTVVVLLTGSDADKGWGAILWNILYQTLTPNPVDPGSGSGMYLGAMLVTTFGSLFLVSILIGILTNAIDNRIQHLRKGRSLVLEENHTLILGWSPKIFPIISELVIANENRKRPHIVILADKDKVEMEDEIRSRIKNTRNTRVVCRTGNPIDLGDLEIVNPHGAKSIIVLSPDGEDPDSQVIKTMLAVTNHPERRDRPYHIVAEVRDPKNLEVAGLVGRDEAQFVVASDLISRITVQTCRQSGLSVVYTELLNFEGDEIYFQKEPALTGKTFGEALMAYEDSAVIGLQSGDRIKLNPPMDTRIGAGDRIIAISEDDDTIKLSERAAPQIDESDLRGAQVMLRKPERTLILGWNQRGCPMLRELDGYVAHGSAVLIVADTAGIDEEVRCLGIDPSNLRVDFRAGDSSDRAVLESLDVPSFQHVIILCYSDRLDTQEADARTLITLLHLRKIAEQCRHSFSIVSEMLDIRNRQLAEVARADDFIVSDMLTSLMLAQISENKDLTPVFADLFDADGSEIYLKPITDFVTPSRPMDFYTVMESARRQGQVAIGYRKLVFANDAEKGYGVVVNPAKSEKITFEPRDKVIVLAES